MYALYVKNKPLSDRLLAEAGTFFQEKQHELMDKMDLASYLLKPVQRLSKYALFLDGISKTMKPNERADLQRAQNLIEFQVSCQAKHSRIYLFDQRDNIFILTRLEYRSITKVQ